jgi:hypothetical protein
LKTIEQGNEAPKDEKMKLTRRVMAVEVATFDELQEQIGDGDGIWKVYAIYDHLYPSGIGTLTQVYDKGYTEGGFFKPYSELDEATFNRAREVLVFKSVAL